MKKESIPRKSFTTRLNPDIIKKLKHAATDMDSPANELIEKAIEDFLKKHPLKK